MEDRDGESDSSTVSAWRVLSWSVLYLVVFVEVLVYFCVVWDCRTAL